MPHPAMDEDTKGSRHVRRRTGRARAPVNYNDKVDGNTNTSSSDPSPTTPTTPTKPRRKRRRRRQRAQPSAKYHRVYTRYWETKGVLAAAVDGTTEVSEAKAKASFTAAQRMYMANLERAIPTECYQMIASYLDPRSRALLAACDRHLHDQVVFGPDSGATVWSSATATATAQLDEPYARRYNGSRFISMPALLHASATGAAAAVRVLLDAKADVEARSDFDGRTALFNAIDGQYVTIVDMLVRAGANVNAVDRNGESPLYFACYFGYVAVVKRLLAAGALTNQGATLPLEAAAAKDHRLIVAALLDARGDVNRTNVDGWSALMWAGSTGACASIRLLVAAGANVNMRSGDGDTALVRACIARKTKAVKALLGAKADPDILDNERRTALMLASVDGYTDVVTVLLAANASVFLTDVYGCTALMMRGGRRDGDRISQLLLSAGAGAAAAAEEERRRRREQQQLQKREARRRFVKERLRATAAVAAVVQPTIRHVTTA